MVNTKSSKEDSHGIIFKLFNEIGIINQLSTARLEKCLPEGIKASQFGILNHFVRLGDGSTPLELANAFQITKAAMTNNLNRLLQKGMIKIKPDSKDGRSKRVFITKKGTDTRNDAIQSVSMQTENLLKDIDLSEFSEIIPFLTKLRIFLDKNRG